jgi:hypothetical protein
VVVACACLQMIPTAMGPIPPHLAAQGMTAYAVPAPAAMSPAAAAAAAGETCRSTEAEAFACPAGWLLLHRRRTLHCTWLPLGIVDVMTNITPAKVGGVHMEFVLTAERGCMNRQQPGSHSGVLLLTCAACGVMLYEQRATAQQRPSQPQQAPATAAAGPVCRLAAALRCAAGQTGAPTSLLQPHPWPTGQWQAARLLHPTHPMQPAWVQQLLQLQQPLLALDRISAGQVGYLALHRHLVLPHPQRMSHGVGQACHQGVTPWGSHLQLVHLAPAGAREGMVLLLAQRA